jgi:hypothetical protein
VRCVADQHDALTRPAVKGDLLDRGDVHVGSGVERVEQRRGGLGELREQLVEPLRGDAVGCVVNLGSRQRRSSSARSRRRLGSSETPSGVQHYRPCRDLGGSRREEAPADLDPRAGHCPGLKRQPAHGAVYPVRPDDEIVFAARPVAELDSDDAVALGEALHSQPDSDGSSRAASRRSLCSSDRCSARHARRLPRARLRRPRTAACRGGRRSAGA